MKRTFLLLMLIMITLYGKLGYELLMGDGHLKSSLSGSLSDIAETVTAIPLQDTGKEQIHTIKCVRREKDNLFLISNDILYRFDTSGKFICRITDPGDIQVAGYVIDPLTEQLCLEKQVVKYDSSFQKIETQKLLSADLTDKPLCSSFFQLELALSEDTRSLYAYSSPAEPDCLLKDTLLIRRRQLMPGHPVYGGDIAVYPLRFGQRYWLSSYHNPADPSQSYIFCFDQDSSKSWQVKGGFKDNFYHTGSVGELQAIDIYSNAYYYCKSGEEVKKAFPGRTDNDNPVVFIIQLKG